MCLCEARPRRQFVSKWILILSSFTGCLVHVCTTTNTYYIQHVSYTIRLYYRMYFDSDVKRLVRVSFLVSLLCCVDAFVVPWSFRHFNRNRFDAYRSFANEPSKSSLHFMLNYNCYCHTHIYTCLEFSGSITHETRIQRIYWTKKMPLRFLHSFSW